MKKETTTKLLTIIGLMSLFTLSAFGADLGGIAKSAEDIKTVFFNVAKVVAALGLLFIIIKYFLQASEQRSIPWGWVVAAILLGGLEDILTLFGLK